MPFEHYLDRRFTQYFFAKEYLDKIQSEGYTNAKIVKRGKFWYVKIPESNPSKSSLLKKLRKGIQGTVKLSRGRLIIKT